MDQEEQRHIDWWKCKCEDLEKWIEGQNKRIQYLESELHRYQCLLRGEDTFMNSFKTSDPEQTQD